jgi:Zn-finger nucleic acid-binding protein
MTMQCPVCDKSLHETTIGEVRVEECSECLGLWMDVEELRRAKDSVDGDLNWMDFELWKHPERFQVSARPVVCPRCDVDMAAIDYDDTRVVVDYCPHCQGVWLEADEFRKIIEALTEELTTMSPSEYLRASLAEAAEIVAGPESPLSEWKDFTTVMRFFQYRVLAGHPGVVKALAEFQRQNPLR